MQVLLCAFTNGYRLFLKAAYSVAKERKHSISSAIICQFHTGPFLIHTGMDVTVQRNIDIRVSQQTAYSFAVPSVCDAPGRKSMPKIMKTYFGKLILIQKVVKMFPV